MLIPITFETNDDAFMMNYLSGGATGKPEADILFSRFLWGKLISSFYIVNAGIPWYTISFLILIFLSLVAVCYCTVSFFPAWGGSLFCLLYFCMFLYYSVVLQFTMVAAYCGIAVIALMLLDREEEERKNIIIKNIIIFSFMFFAVNIRHETGYLVLGNAAFAVCLEGLRYLLKISDRRKMKNIAVSFITICAVTGISIGVNSVHESRSEWRNFREYNAERVDFADYSKLDYEANKDLFDGIGWSEDLYELVQSWFYMDQTVNLGTFRQINERNVHGPIHVGRGLLHDWFPKIEFQIKMWVLLLALLFVDAIRRHDGRYKERFISFLWIFVWFAETQYFGYTGRVVERAFEAWTLLALVPSVLGGREESGKCLVSEERSKKKDIAEHAVLSVIMLLLCIVCVRNQVGGYINAKTFSLAKRESQITQATMEDYAMAHPQNIYIYEWSLRAQEEPWRVHPDGKPCNLIFWGGSFYHSPLYYAQIEKNGFEHIFEEDFFRENVYLIAKEAPDETLQNVMEEKFPGCTCEVIDEEEKFIVYRFKTEAERNK